MTYIHPSINLSISIFIYYLPISDLSSVFYLSSISIIYLSIQPPYLSIIYVSICHLPVSIYVSSTYYLSCMYQSLIYQSFIYLPAHAHT